MELKLVIKTGRSAVVEFDDGGKYYSKEEYTLLINGEEYGKTEKVVTTIYGLKPDTEYKITAVYAGKEYGPVEFKTDYEYVTLNVREFGAYGDSDIPNDGAVNPTTISNAATIVAILPFMIIYPFCQKYFVQGVNVGAVKE